MEGQAIITVSATVVALTQLAKWSGIPDRLGPFAVLLLSLMGVTFWAWTQGDFARPTAFAYFAGWIAVATSAAGVYGFTRASREAVTATTAPPSGAGASLTIKDPADVHEAAMRSTLTINSADGKRERATYGR